MSSSSIPSPSTRSYVFLLTGVLGVSFAALLVRWAEAPALVIAFYRMALATAFTALYTLAWYREELLSVGRRDLVLAAASGAFLALHFYVWNLSLEYTSVASSTVLVTMQPIFVVLGSTIFLGERLSFKALAAAGLALSGSLVIGFGDFGSGSNTLWGDFLALSGAVLVAGYMLIGRRLRQRQGLWVYNTLVYASCSLLLLAAGLAAGGLEGPYSANTWLCFLGLAVIPTILGHSLLNAVLKEFTATLVSVAILGEPVGATILAVIFLGEVPSLLQVAGGIIIIAGIYLFIMITRDQEGTPSSIPSSSARN